MKVSHGNKGNEHRWNKCQERRGPRGNNIARGGTCEGREGTTRPAWCPTSAGKSGTL